MKNLIDEEIEAARQHFGSLGSQTSQGYWDEITKYFGALIARNFSREQMYLIVNDLAKTEPSLGFPQELVDQIGNFETGLTGRCSRSSIIRLSPALNEPIDHDEFVAYVRNLRWTKDPNIRPVN